MSASPRSAIWPQLVAISLIGLGVASCSDSGRFGDLFSSNSAASRDQTGALVQSAPANHVESQPLPRLATADGSVSGGGRDTGSYQPADATGSVRTAAAPQPSWTWEGGMAITIRPGETLEVVAREHGVPVSAIMQANNIANASDVYAGERLVIPRYRSTVAATVPQTRAAAVSPALAAPVGAPRSALVAPSGVHVVGVGETLNSIARLYRKPVMVIARANNLPLDTRVKVGERMVIPEMKEAPRTASVPRAEPSATPSTGSLAMAEPSHSVRIAEPAAETSSPQNSVKTAEPASSLPSFRWPVRGRVIAAFGPKPNGLQNDGINLAVPEGTPIKAAEDGVVAYAGNELKGYGNLVLVRHANGFVTAYANASDILVKRGETVKRGQVIAHSGQTGSVTSPQLHFEIRKGATPVDPAQYLNGA
jgi:murein DD-endopeptidase MepM/ murein hydrolase activator NlpD